MSSSSPKTIGVRSIAESCVRMKKLGYIVGRHMDLYGEHIELVSDPFADGDCVAVRAVSAKDPTVRTIELPVSIISGWDDLFAEAAGPVDAVTPAKTPLPKPPGRK
jgi:hypothetical protein